MGGPTGTPAGAAPAAGGAAAAEFHRRHGEAFPGAEITDSLDPFVCALRWRAPARAASG